MRKSLTCQAARIISKKQNKGGIGHFEPEIKIKATKQLGYQNLSKIRAI